MTQIDNKNLADFGLVLMKYKSLLSMPGRVGTVFHDWGNELQPLVQEEDINWGANPIGVGCLFDPRLGVSLEECLYELRQLHETTLATDYGTFNVVLVGVSEVEIKGSFATMNINFEQRDKDFDSITLDAAIGGSGFGIDGYDFFRDFGIVVSKTRFLNNIPEYQISNETVHNTAKKRSELRKWGIVRAECTVPLGDVAKVLKMQKLLSQTGLRKLGHQGLTYDCFLSEGFAMEFFKDYAKFVLVLNVGGRDSTIEVRGNGIVIQPGDLSPDLADHTRFVETDIQGGGSSRTFTIHNLSAGTLTINSIEAPGSDFSIAGNPSGGIGPGGTMNFTVNFNPASKGGKASTIAINNSDLLFTPYVFKVAGQAYDSSEVGIAQMALNAVAVNNGDLTPTVVDHTDFGDVESNGQSKSVFLAVANIGNLTMTLKSLTLIGASFFSFTRAQAQRTISPGGSTTAILKFTPTANGVEQPLVSMVWNNGRDAGDLTYEFRVRGNGVEPAFVPNIAVSYNGTDIPNGSSPSEAFGTIFPDRVSGEESTTRIFNIQNIGGEYIRYAYLSGDPSFYISSPKETPIAPGGSINLSVRFSPHGAAGTKTTTLYVKTTTQTYSCDLRGLSVAPPPVMSALITGNGREVHQFVTDVLNGTDFGERVPGQDPFIINRFRIKNTGNVAWNVSSGNFTALKGPPGFDVMAVLQTGVINPNAYVEIDVRFIGSDVTSTYFDRILINISANDPGVVETIDKWFSVTGFVNNTGLQ